MLMYSIIDIGVNDCVMFVYKVAVLKEVSRGHKDVWVSESISPRLLNLGTRLR